MKKAVILGAGVGGLSAGYFLARSGQFEVTVLERAPVIGGLCGSFEYNGFTLDYGAHKLYSVIPGILDECHALMGDRLLRIPKKHRIFLQGHAVDYPMKLGNLAKALGLGLFIKLGLGYAAAFLRGVLRRCPARSYEEYIIRRFGRFAYSLVFEPLADKVWGNPSELHVDMARARVPASGGMEVILKLFGIRKETAETNAEFFYYPSRGFGDIARMFSEQIEKNGGNVFSGAEPIELLRADSRITAVKVCVHDACQTFSCDYVISSIPLPDLGRLVFPWDTSRFDMVIKGLGFRHLIIVFLFVKRSLVLEDQWIFFPEREFIFSRIFEQKQMNPELGPPDRTAIACDFTCDEESWVWRASDDELAAKCVEGLVRGGFIHASEVDGHLVRRFRRFYPRYDLSYKEKLRMVNSQLQTVENLISTGRLGMYNYNNADHCMDMGKFIAERLAVGIEPRAIWDKLEEHVGQYKIVD